MSRFDLFFILVDDCNEVQSGRPVGLYFWHPLMQDTIIDVLSGSKAVCVSVCVCVCVCVSQVTDYAIARRIVDLHCRGDESVDRLYSLDEMRRYLLFARQFKPKVCVCV